MDVARQRETWINSTAVIIASGPSLTRQDCDFVVEKWLFDLSKTVRIILINDSWRATDGVGDVLYGADPEWWRERKPDRIDCCAEYWTQNKNWKNPNEHQDYGLRCIRSEPGADLSLDMRFIYQGSNSSFQAMNLAVLFGASRIVFLGLDLSADGDKTHWHDYPDEFKRMEPGYALFQKAFETVAPKLQSAGVEVINASRRTALECFPRQTIQEALA